MTETDQYYAITIGPIIETLRLTSSPCGLWACSYLFSSLSRNICRILYKQTEIITPYCDEVLLNKKDGIGMFPDRIIFKANALSMDEVKKITEEAVLKSTALLFGIYEEPSETAIKYFNEYFQLHIIKFSPKEWQNVITASSQALSVVELEHSFPIMETYNYILDRFELRLDLGEEQRISRNDNIKNSRMVKNINNWQLLESSKGTIRDLESIAAAGFTKDDKARKWMKKHSYYVIVQSDGDNMGKLISDCTDDKAVNTFSKKCLDYTSVAAGLINGWGGVTIYAGGDDLLFIAPVENNNNENILYLLRCIQSEFEKTFGEGSDMPTVSFGVSVCYYKFPLYESFEIAFQMLRKAKDSRIGKNALALSFQKHSGLSIGILFKEFSKNLCYKNTIKFINKHISESAAEDILNSVSFKMALHEALFVEAIKSHRNNTESSLEYIFKNTFDSDIHRQTNVSVYLDDIGELLKSSGSQLVLIEKEYDDADEQNECAVKQDMSDEQKLMRAFNGLLRVIKFFSEAGDEEL